MSKKSVVVMPDTQKVLENMGEQIKMHHGSFDDEPATVL